MSTPDSRNPNDDPPTDHQHSDHQHSDHQHSDHRHSDHQRDHQRGGYDVAGQDADPANVGGRLSAAEFGDLVASVPFLLRYRPGPRTAVVVAIKDGRIAYASGAFDLSEAAERADQAWAYLRRPERHVSPDQLVVIGYVDHHQEGTLLEFAAAGRHIAGHVLRVHDGRWWHLLSHTPTTPTTPADSVNPSSSHDGPRRSNGADGADRADRADGPDRVAAFDDENETRSSDPGTAIPVGAELFAAYVLAGAAVCDSRAALGDFLQPRRQEVLDEVNGHLVELTGSAGTADSAGTDATDTTDATYATDTSVAWMVAMLESERARRMQRPSALTPVRAARLLHALDRIVVRDVCIGWRDDAAWQLWCDLVGYAPPGHVAPVATLIALIAAQRGDGPTARVALEHALSDNADYGLALLLQLALDYATPPDVLTALIDEAISNHPDT